MRALVSWLNDWVDIGDIDTALLVESLNLVGLEVEKVSEIGKGISGVVVGQIKSLERHPALDKLQVAHVDLGSSNIVLVTGATNIKPGMLVPVALPGAKLATGMIVQSREFKGILSQGVMCSELELGIGEDHSGIYVLPGGISVGMSFEEAFPPDVAVDFEITPNRPDLLSHMGIGREASAVFKKPFRLEEAFLARDKFPKILDVEILEPTLCFRYIALVIDGVSVEDSPLWLKRRLMLAGMRPISNVVDVMNYVMLDVGQPLHAFDLDRLSGPKIVVRKSPGDTMLCLDGVERMAGDDVLCICDEKDIIAFAGIMGGELSSVTRATKRIVVESATFYGPNIRRTSRSFALRTEASSRFERQLDTDLAELGALKAWWMIKNLMPVAKLVQVVDICKNKTQRPLVRLDVEKVNGILSLNLSSDEIVEILKRLHFSITRQNGDVFVSAPIGRLDISNTEDLAEEVGRIYGANLLPSRLVPGVPAPADRASKLVQRRWLREFAAGEGFNESVNFSLTGLKDMLKLGYRQDEMVILNNAMSEELNVLRPSLLPSLLETLRINRSRGTQGYRFFELGRIYFKDDKEYREKEAIGFISQVSDDSEVSKAEFYVLKGVVQAIISQYGKQASFERSSAGNLLYHHGRSATVIVGGQQLGVVAELSKFVLDEYDLGGRVVFAEVLVDDLLQQGWPNRRYRALPRFPHVERDLAFVVSDAVTSQQVLEAIWSCEVPALEQAVIFDEYKDPRLGEGNKSLAVRTVFREMSRTLTDEEVDEYIARIIKQVELKVGGQLRG